MKIRELIESPYLVPHEYDPKRKVDFAYSDSTLDRDFKTLYTEIILGKEYRYSIHKDLIKAIVTTPATNRSNENLNKLLVDLELKIPSEPIGVNNPLQVVTVSADKSTIGLGLTSSLYIILAKKKYTVISDLVQYLGGKGLWKKIAKNSKSVGLRVRLWNLETEDWLRNSNGEYIEYDTTNMNDDEVWQDFTLIMTQLSNRKTSFLVLSY